MEFNCFYDPKRENICVFASKISVCLSVIYVVHIIHAYFL